MNRKYLIIAVAVLALGCIGTLQAFTHLETQEPQEIRGIVVDEYDAAWYEQQPVLQRGTLCRYAPRAVWNDRPQESST